MTRSWEWLRGRLTPARRLFLALGLVSVALAPLALVVGVALGQTRVAAVIALGIWVADAAALALVVRWALRRSRTARAASEGEAVDIAGPSRPVADGSLQTPDAESIR